MNRLFAWLAAGGMAWGLLLGALPAEAKESPRRFYEALRQHGYFEQALDYLDEVRESGSGETGFREVLDYEAGLTLIDLAHAAHSAAEGEKLLDRADHRLACFLAEHSRHVLAAAAKTQLAGVLVERGRLKAEQARSFDPRARQQSVESVRALYRQAETAFLASEKQFEDVLAKLPRFLDPNDPKQAPRIEQRAASAAGLAADAAGPGAGARRSARPIPPARRKTRPPSARRPMSTPTCTTSTATTWAGCTPGWDRPAVARNWASPTAHW